MQAPARSPRRSPERLHQRGADLADLLVDLPAGQFVERGQHGRGGDRVAVERAGVGDRPAGHAGEQVTPPGDRRARPAGRHRLAVHGQVRVHAEAFRGPAQRHPEAADRLVEDEHRAALGADPADRLQVARLGDDHARVEHDRLHDHRGHLAALRGHQLLEREDVVPLQRDDVAQRGGGLALAGRGGHGALVTGVDVVQPAVVVAVEPDHLGPAGGGPGHPQRGLHHLRAGTAEPHGLRPAEHGQHPFRRLDLPLMRGRVDDPMPLRGQHLLHHSRRSVAEDVGSLAEQVVDVLRAVGVPDPAAGRALHDQVRVEQPGVAAHPARQRTQGTLLPVVLPAASHRCLLWKIRPCPPRPARRGRAGTPHWR